MTKEVVIAIRVKLHNEEITPAQVRDTIAALINIGTADAYATLASGEGDMEGAQIVNDLAIGSPQIWGTGI